MHYFTLSVFLLLSAAINTILPQQYSWRYYNPGNTGIQGDYVEAIWIDHDGDPYIAGYTPDREEGGFSKFIQSENRWVNYSNVDYPVIGNINDVGSSRISDIEEDSGGLLWMATWRGILKFNPAVGGSSLEFFGADNSLHPGGRTKDLAVAPDGSIWAAVLSVVWGEGGLVNYDPSSDQWRYWYYGSTANNWPASIGFCENVSIQQKPSGGYVVWIDGEGWNTMITFDSDTQLFTLLPQNLEPGEVVSLPGNDCTDAANNLWALRYTGTSNIYSLDYRTPDGNWIVPPQPPSNYENDIWAFKAYENGKALLIDGNSNVWQFNGTSWQNFGIWRDGGYSYGLDIDPNGNVWVSGIGGAAKRNVQTGSWQRYRISNSSQITYWAEDITLDNAGNVWIAGNAGPGVGGFEKFDGVRWIGFNNENYGLGYPFPFPTDNVEVVYHRPSNGNIIINPMYNYLHAWNGSGYTSLNYPLDRSEGVVEDSQNRLWSIGDYYSLSYYNEAGNNWIDVPFIGSGTNIKTDPSRPGTIWACSGSQVLRTDGTYNFSKVVDDFTELDPQSDALSTVIPLPDGFAWVGTNQGLAKLDANSGTYQFFSPSNSQIPGESITPLAVTPDGRLWFTNFGSTTTSVYGLGWFDGTNFGIFPQQQTEGLPHAQIYDVEVKMLQDGYELWLSCASRGVAVLTVTGSIIPVELVSFEVNKNNADITLNWITSSETNNYGFEIERKQSYNDQLSFGNSEWTRLDFLSGHGTTTEKQSYAFIDENLPDGKYIYRLKQIDFDGSFKYSNEVEVTIGVPGKFELSQNYPNPFNPTTTIKYSIPVEANVKLAVYNSLGEKISDLVNTVQASGNYQVTWNAKDYASGIYFYALEVSDMHNHNLFKDSRKIVLVK